ncbi:Synaptic vesicular amine transporter [Choanephora cucurbitarum]|uniref:Synaptic vesicular amine transporter n=1 Tax=Choanephora cucurbitarum TaxID=101091 RepID=A0A1C7N4X5_9FUNG|nr:Synaptic vesicular amine transporter [Choanephora cucurbitarum]
MHSADINCTHLESLDETTKPLSWYARAQRSAWSVAMLVALILFTDMLAYGAIIPCLPTLIIEKLHGTPKDIGILFGCFAFGYLISTPLFAVYSDTYKNRRYPIMLGSVCLIGSTLCFAWATCFSMFVIARLFQGVSAGASWTIGLGMLADTFPTETLGRVMGTVIIAHTVGFVLGPVIGGILYEAGGIRAPFYFCGLFGLFTLTTAFWIAESDKGQLEEHVPLITNGNKRVVLAGIEPALPIYLLKKYNASTATIGTIFVALVVPCFLGPLTGYLSDKYGRPYFIVAGMVLASFSAFLLSLPWEGSMYSVVPLLFLYGLSNPVVHTPLMPEMGYIVSQMNSTAYAQVYALYNMAYSLGTLIGPLVAGCIMSSSSLGDVSHQFHILMLLFSALILLFFPVSLVIAVKKFQ